MKKLNLSAQLVASCCCLTKTPEWKHHDPLCYYRLLHEHASTTSVPLDLLVRRIMMRNAEDDFMAMQIANAMEAAGAEVFSITPNGQATHPGAMAPHTRLVVWAKVKNDEMIANVDEEISKELNA